MRANAAFGLVLVALDSIILAWGLRVLPRENMQILATIPWRRIESGLWQGVNLTWYGIMQTVGMLLAVALALVLSASASVPVYAVAVVVGLLLAVGLPSSGFVARLVEHRKGTFTVGGAVFVVTLFLPWLALGLDRVSGRDHALIIVSALAVAYPFGEGIGRLACISFGCCYGRRIDQCGPVLRALFARQPAIVVGPTRKAAYAGHCEGVPLIPVPALSALVLSAGALGGVGLFLAGSFRLAGVVSLAVAFTWRFASELLRADYRGEGRLSAYQWMALVCLVYSTLALGLLPGSERLPEVSRGLMVLQSPIVLGALAALGLATFGYLGVSKMTTATVRLEVQGLVAREGLDATVSARNGTT
jgi:prolipoprotein diacylglyceryltransferase